MKTEVISMRQRCVQMTIRNVWVFGCCVGILYGGVAIGRFFGTEWRERGVMRAVAAWEEAARSPRDEIIGAETPEEVYARIYDAVVDEDTDAARALIVGGTEDMMDVLRALPEPERVTFFPDVVSGIARAIAIEDASSTTFAIGGRLHRIDAGPLEHVLLFQQLNNQKWALALP